MTAHCKGFAVFAAGVMAWFCTPQSSGLDYGYSESSLETAPTYVGPSLLTFNFNAVGNLADMLAGNQGVAQQDLGQQVVDGFATAGDAWSAIFNDDITINIEIDYGALGNGVLGGALTERDLFSYTNTRTAMTLDASSTDDLTATSNLSLSPSLDIYINRTSDNPNGSGSATPYIDSDGSFNNQNLRLARANAKSIGLISGTDAASDANITFTDFSDFVGPISGLDWDFDSSDGVGASDIDFVTVATHEIGHAMGFISGVDVLDNNSPPVNGPFAANDFSFLTTMDLFRQSADSLAAGADLDFTADVRDKNFSIDGGATLLEAFSEGSNFGDGEQASHWKDDAFTGTNLGIMDPTLGTGVVGSISAADIRLLDVIGYTLIPEPSSVLALLGLSGLMLARRRAA